MSNVVLSKDKQGIRVLTLNRPEKLNAINEDLIMGLRDALAAANADESVRVIILHGAGSAFCSGDDLAESLDESEKGIDPQRLRDICGALQDVTRQIMLSEKFVIGAIHGWAVGGGFEWAINCDFPIWAEGAKGFFSEMRWGLFPTGGVSKLLAQTVGLAKAREMLLFGDKYEASDLLDMGLAWRVVSEETLLDEAYSVAARIAALPEHAVGSLKSVISKAVLPDLEDILSMETTALVESIGHPETISLMKEFVA